MIHWLTLEVGRVHMYDSFASLLVMDLFGALGQPSQISFPMKINLSEDQPPRIKNDKSYVGIVHR